MRSNQDRMVRLLGPAIIGCAIAVAAAAATSLAAVSLGSASVGDMIVFKPGGGADAEQEPLIAVHRPGQFGCVLDLNTLRRSGGSLVIEARMPTENRAYRLHWAGERTAVDASDCGPSADVIIDRRDLSALAAAAGGFGIARGRATAYVIGTAN